MINIRILLTFILLGSSVVAFAVGGTVTASANGNWNSAATWANTNINRTGTISATNTSTNVTGSGTSFLTELSVGSVIQRQTGTAIGTVASIQSDTQLTLTANSSSTTTGTYRTADGPPAPDDAVIINNNVNVTVNMDATVTSLTINGGNQPSSITISSGFTLDVNGTITYGAGTQANDNKSVIVNGSLEVDNLSMINTVNVDRDIILSIGTTGIVTITADLTMPGAFDRNHVDMTGNAVLNVGGDINNGAGAVGGGFTTPPSTSTINLNGTVAQNVFLYGGASSLGILKINNATGVTLGQAVTLTTLTIGDATSNSIFNDGGNQVTSTGTLNLTSGTFKLGATAATTFPAFATRTIASGTTVEYGANASQTVSITPSYHHLTFSGSGTKTVSSGTLSVAGNWDVGSTTALNTNNPTVNVTGNITGSGSITSTSGTLSIGGSWTNNGTFTHNSGTVNYNNPTGGQTIANIAYRNLTLGNTSGTSSAASDLAVINLSITNSGATLNMGTFALSVSGTTPNTGTIRTQHIATATPINSGLTWNSIIEYDASSGGQTIVAGTYVNLKSNNTSGTNTAAAAITVNGPLTVATGGTLDMATFQLTGTSFSTSGDGTIKTQYSLSSAVPSGIVWTTAVEYNRSGTQSIVSGTYATLITSGSGTKTMSGNSTVTGALTLTAGTLAVSTNTLTLQTNAVTKTTGSLSVSTGTVAFDFNNTLNLPNSFFSGGVNNMTLLSGAIVNLPASPNVQAMAGILNLSSGKLGLGTSATLAIGGTVSNMSASNCIVGNGTGSIEIAGSGALGTLFFDQSTPGTTNTLNNFTINRTNLSGTLTIGNTLRVKTLLTPNFGTLTSNGNLVIGSDASGTARIYPAINAANFAFVGDVKVERFSKSKNQRRYLFMSSVVDNISVRNAWQDDIFITGAGSGGTPCGAGTGNGGVTDRYNDAGFDATTANMVTVYRYDQNEAARWMAIPSTSYALQKGRGYRVLYRGARGVDDANCADYLMLNSPSAPSEATLNVSGTLIQGSFTVDVDGPTTGTYGYTLLGNPYACEIEFDKFVTQNSSVAPTYWTYDPNGTTNNTTYLSYTNSPPEVAGLYHSDPGGDPDNYPNPGFIAAGQAFFVQAESDGQVTFAESQKANQVQNGLFKTQALLSKIRVHFRQANNTPIDNIVIRFSNDPAVTTAENKNWDAITFNSGNFMASIKGTRSFAIQTRPLNFFNDTVQLRIVSSTTGSFKLEFTNFADFVEAAQIILIDQFTGTQTDVKLNPVYPFTITSSSSSQAGRFKLVFRSMSSLLPLSYINVSASQKTQGVEVAWKVAFEQGVSKYLVERSEDGSSFSVIGSVESKGNSNVPVGYAYMDLKPLKGTGYYRIKSVENGDGKYSPIVKVNATIGQSGFVIYPNPVKDRLAITMQHNVAFEKATITIRNTQGKTIRQVVNVPANGYVLDVADLAAGMYIITLTNKNGESLIEKFVKY